MWGSPDHAATTAKTTICHRLNPGQGSPTGMPSSARDGNNVVW